MSTRRQFRRGLVGIGAAMTAGLMLAGAATAPSTAGTPVPLAGGVSASSVTSSTTLARVSDKPRSMWRVNGTVYAVTVARTRVYVGGDFASVTHRRTGERVGRRNLVAFQRATGQLVRTWRPSTNGPVRDVAVSRPTGQVFIGGAFTKVNGRGKRNIASLGLSNGALDQDWTGYVTNGDVQDLLLRRGRVYAAGSFYRRGDRQGPEAQQHGLAAFRSSDGAVVRSWKAKIGPGRALTLLVAGDGRSLLVGGGFDTLSEQPRTHLGAVNFGTGAVTGWRPAPACNGCSVIDLAQDGSRRYAAMAGRGGRVVAYTPQRRAALWETKGNGDVQALGVHRGVVYAGGHFERFAGRDQPQLVGLQAATGRINSFRPAFGGPSRPGVWALSAGPDYLRVGGGFGRIGRAKTAGYAEFRVTG